jgi:hypothetical protein
MRTLFAMLLLLLSGCGDPEDQAAIIYKAATESLEHREPLEAEELLTRIIRDYPNTRVAPQAVEAYEEFEQRLEGIAISGLERIHASQEQFAEAKEGRYANALLELVAARLIEAELSAVTRTGYRFRISASDDNSDYTVQAIPIMNRDTKKHFFVDRSGVIRWERGTDASVASPEV